MSSQARVLERPDRVPARNGSKTAKKPAAYCDQPSATSVASDPQDWAARQVREWLLLILRFSVTTDPKGLSATLALADEIDARGLEWRPSAPSFFRRTSNDVCRAITALDDPKRAAILKRHLARIDNRAAQQNAANARRRHRLGFRHRRGANSLRSCRHLPLSNRRAFVRLRMRPKTHFCLPAVVGHFVDVRLECIQIDNQSRRR